MEILNQLLNTYVEEDFPVVDAVFLQLVEGALSPADHVPHSDQHLSLNR